MKLVDLFASFTTTWPTETVDTSWPPSTDGSLLAAQVNAMIEVEDVVTAVGADGTVTITGTLSLDGPATPQKLETHLFPSLGFTFTPEADWSSAFRASVSPSGVRTVQIDSLPLTVAVPPDLLGAHPDASKRSNNVGIELSESAGDTKIERTFAFAIEADGTVRLDPHLPISVGTCTIFGTPAKGVHELSLLSAPDKAKESVDWLVRGLNAGIIPFDGGALAFGGIELDFDVDGTALHDLRERLHISEDAEIVLEDLVIPSVLLPPVPLHGSLGVRHTVNRDEPLSHAISFEDAPITIPLGNDAQGFISQLFFETPAEGEEWWSGLTLEGGVSWSSGNDDDRLAVTLGFIDGDVLRLGFEKSPPGSDLPIIHLDLWKITVDITGVKLGVSIPELMKDSPDPGAAIQALVTIVIKEKPGEGEGEGASDAVRITDENGGPFEAALVDVGWDRGKPTGNMVMPRGGQLHLSRFVLEAHEMGMVFEHGATYFTISGGIREKSDPFEGAIWFTRLRGKLAGNPDAPSFQLGGIGLEFAIENVVKITVHGVYRDDILPDGTRIKEQGLGGGIIIYAGDNEWGLNVDLFWGTRTPPAGPSSDYQLFLIALYGAIPMGPIELRGVEALYANGLMPKLAGGDREAGELKYYSWLKRARPTASPENRGLDAWKPTDDAWAFGLGLGLSITGAGSVFQLKAFGAGFDSPTEAGLIIVIEFGMFGSKKPIALGVFEYDFKRDAFVLVIQLDVNLKDLIDNWPEELTVKVSGTLAFGNKPGLVAIGRLNDVDTWLGAHLGVDLSEVFELKLRVGICFEWQENSHVGGGLNVALTITGSMGVIALQGWGALEVFIKYMLSGTNDFTARIRAEVGFAIILFGFLRFGISIELLAEWLAHVPHYFAFRVTFRFETPWFLPDVSYTAEFVRGDLEPADRGVATSPLLDSGAQSRSGSKHNRVQRLDSGKPGDKTKTTAVNALAPASGAFQGESEPVALDATIEIDFSVMLEDRLGLGLETTNPDLGLQESGDDEMKLTTRYRLVGLTVTRRPLSGGAWETIEELTSASDVPHLRWAWDHDTRVKGDIATKKLLLNGAAPFTVGIDNPTADAEILGHNPRFPCCQVRRPDVARFDFEPEAPGPLPSGFIRDFTCEDRGTTAPVRIHGAPCSVAAPPASGASTSRVGVFAPRAGALATVSATEELAAATLRLAVLGRYKARVMVVAIDARGEEVDRKAMAAGGTSFIDIDIDPGAPFSTLIVAVEDLQREGDEEVPVRVAIALESVECITLADRERFERESERCSRVSTDGPAQTVTFLARHEYDIAITTAIGVKHSSTNMTERETVEHVRFTTAGPPGLNETPEPGLELEPYIVSHTPGGRGITYREESVHLVLSDALRVFGPGSGSTEADFRLPITIAVESGFDANPAAHEGKASRASAEWFLANRAEPDPWVTTAVLGISRALTKDGTLLRYQRLSDASSGTCPPDDVWVERQPRVGVDPFDLSGRALWEPLASYVAAMRLEGSPVVERSPWETADITAFGATTGTWAVTDGVLEAAAACTGDFGEDDWDLYRVDVRGRLGDAGEIGVAVLTDAAASSAGVRALLRRTGAGGTLIVETTAGVAIDSAHVAAVGDDSAVVVEVFADAIRCSCGDAVVSVPRADRGPGACRLIASGAAIATLRVHGVDMYRQPFRTSRYEGFSEHIATCAGIERHDAGAAAEALTSVRTRLAGPIAAAMDPQQRPVERERVFGDAASSLATPLREDADRLHVTCVNSGADRWLLLESPEPLDFTEEIELSLTRRVDHPGLGPADQARLGALLEAALRSPFPLPLPLPLPGPLPLPLPGVLPDAGPVIRPEVNPAALPRDRAGVRRLVVPERFGGFLDAPGSRKALYRGRLEGKIIVLTHLITHAESRVRAPALTPEDRALLADATWTMNAQFHIIGWHAPAYVTWDEQSVTVAQNAPGSHALVLPGAALPDGDYRLELAITRRWFDTVDPVGPDNAYLDNATIEFSLAG